MGPNEGTSIGPRSKAERVLAAFGGTGDVQWPRNPGSSAIPQPSLALSTHIDERFLHYTGLAALDDGASFGPWHVVFDGVDRGAGVRVSKGRLRLMPQTSLRVADTNSTLVVSRKKFGASALQLNASWTAKRTTRLGTANPWETGWLVWDYVDPDHFTYLILKPNGWEVGRRDPSQPGTQRFIADADAPVTPIGMARTVSVLRNGSTTVITVDGTRVTSYELPASERHGAVGMYTEDAVVDCDQDPGLRPASLAHQRTLSEQLTGPAACLPDRGGR